MLEKLLERISRGGAFSIQSLAAEFGVSKEMMEAMFEDLARLGYLRQVEDCAPSACGSCQVAQSCKPQGKRWVLVRRPQPKQG